MSCTLEGGLRPPSFLISMWFCFVFCVGFLFINWGKSCILWKFTRCVRVLYFRRWPSATFFFNRHVVLLCVLCWFLVYRLGHVLYSLGDYSLGTCLVLWKVATGHFFITGIWLCFVFCVGFWFTRWGMSCDLWGINRWGHVLYFGRWPSVTFFFNKHVVLLCVLCWFLIYQLGQVLYSLKVWSLGACLVL